ncbi:hypothetical protein V8C37DRAFT_389258 [Trichoderma ceciliae]
MRVFSEQQRQKSAINPAFSSLLPKEARFHQASTSIQNAREKYGDLMSSPTREGLRQASLVVTEACTLEKHVNHFIVDRNHCIEKLSSRRKRGGLVRPTGEFHTAVSLSQIQSQDEKTRDANAKKMEKAQLREARRIKRITFKSWLDQTNKKDDFLALDVQNKQFAALLGYREVPYYIDNPPLLSQHTKEAIMHALKKPLILDQLSECSWGAPTNSLIDIRLGPFSDQDDDNNEATQEETQETTQETTQKTLIDLAGDSSGEDDFLSLPLSSLTLPRLKTPSKTRERPYNGIRKLLDDFKAARNS